jgi:hypothetical protein
MMTDLHVFTRYIGERRDFIAEELSRL